MLRRSRQPIHEVRVGEKVLCAQRAPSLSCLVSLLCRHSTTSDCRVSSHKVMKSEKRDQTNANAGQGTGSLDIICVFSAWSLSVVDMGSASCQ